MTYDGRTTANWGDFLCRVEGWVDPAAKPVDAVADNLNTHSALECSCSIWPIRAGNLSSNRNMRPI